MNPKIKSESQHSNKLAGVGGNSGLGGGRGGEYQFTVNITPNDYNDAPIVPAEDGLLTAPDGSVLTPYSLLELSQKSATTQRRQRKKTNDRNGDYIPRPPNPFILFRCWYTAKVHKPGSHDNADGTLSSLCGQEWANLGTQQRRIFEEAAKIEKLKHAERYPNYRYKPVHKKKQKQSTDDDDDSSRPARPRPRKTSSRTANSSDKSVAPVSTFPARQPLFSLPPALVHRRSSSVPPLPSEMQLCGGDVNVDPSMRPIELPAAPFLALAGHDIPISRKSRPSLGWDWTRGMSQVLNEPPAQVFDYTAMRTSIPSVPPLPNVRHRAQLPAFHHLQYAAAQHPPPFFATQFSQQESTIKWNNPNPFATISNSNSPGQFGTKLPQLVNGDSTSSSSCSAPSPPPELEISPLDPVPVAEKYDMKLMPHSASNMPYAMDSRDVQPFELGIFKKSLDFSKFPPNYPTGGRQRGMSIFDEPLATRTTHTLANAVSDNYTPAALSGPFTEFNAHNDQGYLRALNSSNIPIGIPTHEEIMEGYA